MDLNLRRALIPQPVFAVACAMVIGLTAAVDAMVGGATQPPEPIARTLVVITGSRGNICTGTALTRDLILTAGHCIHPDASFRVSEFDLSRSSYAMATKAIVVHPQFDRSAYDRNLATADIALIKLAAPLSDLVRSALLSKAGIPAVGDKFTVAGFGISVPNSDIGIGNRRGALLVTVGRPSTLQVRLADPKGGGERAGLGACEGDSGAPAFEDRDGTPAVAGVVSWAAGPRLGPGCGGLTGLTPLMRYRAWIVATAAKLGSPLPP